MDDADYIRADLYAGTGDDRVENILVQKRIREVTKRLLNSRHRNYNNMSGLIRPSVSLILF